MRAAGEMCPLLRVPTAATFPQVAPLTGETFRVQFTAGRELRDKLRQAQDLLRHRVPDGNVAIIIERALDVLIDEVKRERFAIGRKPRSISGDRQRSESGCASSDRVA